MDDPQLGSWLAVQPPPLVGRPSLSRKEGTQSLGAESLLPSSLSQEFIISRRVFLSPHKLVMSGFEMSWRGVCLGEGWEEQSWEVRRSRCRGIAVSERYENRHPAFLCGLLGKQPECWQRGAEVGGGVSFRKQSGHMPFTWSPPQHPHHPSAAGIHPHTPPPPSCLPYFLLQLSSASGLSASEVRRVQSKECAGDRE